MSKRGKGLSIWTFILMPLLGISQLSTFDIASYERPDLKRKTLQWGGDIFGAGGFNSNSFFSSDNFNLSIDLDAKFTSFTNTEKNQKFHSSSVFIDLTDDLVIEDDLRLRYGYSGNLTNRIFFKNEFFFEYQLIANTIFSRPNPTTFVDLQDIRFSVPLSIGKGRLELVSDAWNAVTILKDLKKKNLLNREISHDEIYAFAEKISDIKNARIFDFRYENIYELDQLLHFLVDNKMSDESIELFATLNDTWRYETNFGFFGNQIRYAGTSYGIQLRTDAKVDKEMFQEDGALFYLGLFYGKFKPINHHWQFNQNYSVGIVNGRSNYSFISSYLRGINENFGSEISASWTLANYISARAYFEFRLVNELFVHLENSQFDFSTSVDVNFNRWISPRLLWSTSASLLYIEQESSFSQSSLLFPRFSMNWTYFIF